MKVVLSGQTLIECIKGTSYQVTDASGTTVDSQGPFVKTVNHIAPDADGDVEVAGGSGGGTVTQVAGVNPDGSGHVALTQDNIPDGTTNKQYTATDKTKLGAITGSNTGDETAATIKTKLGITTLSGANTGDQTLPTTLPPSGAAGGDLAGTYPNPTLGTVGTAGTYGDATHVPQLTTDANGRVTAVTPVTITQPTTLPPNGAAGGDLAGTYPNPTLGTAGTAGTYGSASSVPVEIR